jgi:hypothetical protein
VNGNSTNWRFDSLDGALNDVKDVLADPGITEFVILRDQEATCSGAAHGMPLEKFAAAARGDPEPRVSTARTGGQ